MTDIPAIGAMSRLADAAVGAPSLALEAVRDQRAARRRGGRINSKVAATVESRVEDAITLPERVLLSGLRALRGRAGRSDVSGTAARNLLLLVHGPAGGAAKVFARIEREARPPARRGRRAATAPAAATRARRSTAAATRRGAPGARKTAGRGATGRTRRSA
jgi:hypothetical protein